MHLPAAFLLPGGAGEQLAAMISVEPVQEFDLPSSHCVIQDRSMRLPLTLPRTTAPNLCAGAEKFHLWAKSAFQTSRVLRAVYVHPRVGRRGVGAKILEQLEQAAVDLRLPELELEASLNAEAFYRRHGYEVLKRAIHRLASGHGMACVKMRKLLPG